MRKLKTAVIGLGRIGWQFHIPEVIRHDGFELTAVVDPVAERRQEAEQEFKVNSYLSMDAMFEKEDLDIVVIASPTKFHKEQAVLAMQKGCDVFCDKPLAMDVLEAEEMLAAGKRLNKKLMVYQPHRVTRETVSLLNILRRDLIGPVYMIKLAVAEYSRRNDWQAFKKHGGGMLANYGAHFIDQLLYLTGFSPIEKLTCHLKTIASLGDADDVVKALMVNKAGVILDLDINMASAHKLGKWHILGKYGCITDDGEAWVIRYYDPGQLGELAPQQGLAAGNRQYRADETIPWQESRVSFNDFPAIDFYHEVYKYFAGNETPLIPLSQTLHIMQILEQCRN